MGSPAVVLLRIAPLITATAGYVYYPHLGSHRRLHPYPFRAQNLSSFPSSIRTTQLTRAPFPSRVNSHICTLTQTLAFTTFMHLSVPTAHAPSVRAWTRPYLFNLGPIVLTAHLLALALLTGNTLPNLAVNAGMGPRVRQLYGIALGLEVLSVSLVGPKYRAAKMCWEGTDAKATVKGLGMIKRVNGWRLLLVDLPNWSCVLAAVVLELGK